MYFPQNKLLMTEKYTKKNHWNISWLVLVLVAPGWR